MPYLKLKGWGREGGRKGQNPGEKTKMVSPCRSRLARKAGIRYVLNSSDLS